MHEIKTRRPPLLVACCALGGWIAAGCGDDATSPAAHDAGLGDAHAHADGHHETDGHVAEGDGHVHEHDGGHALDEEGCAHLTAGPFVDVTAGAAAAGAPAIAADHRAYRVSLPAGKAGVVTFAAAAAGDLVLFLDAAAPVTIENDQGQPLAIEQSETSIAACTAVKGKHTVELPAVGLYLIELGPVTGDRVTVVAEHGAHDDPR